MMGDGLACEGMKCQHCGGRLEGVMRNCPYCGVRQNVDLRQVNYRTFDAVAAMPCPTCSTALSGVEFQLQDQVLEVEYCESCHGLFFNPGELEVLLEYQTTDLVWMDHVQLGKLQEDLGVSGADASEIKYRKCPCCHERMSPHNFGGRSGVVLDRCGTHGYWLDGGELRRLAEWWRVGGKLVYQENAAKQIKWLRRPLDGEQGGGGVASTGGLDGSVLDEKDSWGKEVIENTPWLWLALEAVLCIISQ